jgi:hypothetical protein
MKKNEKVKAALRSSKLDSFFTTLDKDEPHETANCKKRTFPKMRKRSDPKLWQR